jgi:hypothetical protein
VLVEERGRITARRVPPSSSAGEIWGLDQHLLKRRDMSFACKQSAVYPTTLLRDLGAWQVQLRSRSQTDLFFRLCQRYPVVGIDHPAYILRRGADNHLTGDSRVRVESYRYLKHEYATLMSSPARERYFDSNHRENMARHGRFSWRRIARSLGNYFR